MAQDTRTTPRTRRRDPSIDALRIIAIVAVVAGHVWPEHWMRLATYTWHVPIFFVLSGYLASRLRLRELVRRRAQSLILPYAAWLVIVAAALVGFGDPLRLLAGGAHLPREFAAFWFVTAFFVAIVVAAAIEQLPLGWQWVFALGLLAAGYLTSDVIDRVPLDAGVGLACVVFVVAGRTLRIVQTRLARPALTGAVLLAIAVVLIASGASVPLDLKKGDFGTPVVSVLTALLISWGLVLVAQRVLAQVGARVSAAISQLALGGFMVVLSHFAVLYVVRGAGATQWETFAVALVLPWALAMLALRTPVALVLCGVPWTQPLPLVAAGDAGRPDADRALHAPGTLAAAAEGTARTDRTDRALVST